MRNKNKLARTLTFKGQTKTYSEWAKEVKISADCIRSRKDNGWTDEKTLTTPSRGRGRRKPPKRNPFSRIRGTGIVPI